MIRGKANVVHWTSKRPVTELQRFSRQEPVCNSNGEHRARKTGLTDSSHGWPGASSSNQSFLSLKPVVLSLESLPRVLFLFFLLFDIGLSTDMFEGAVTHFGCILPRGLANQQGAQPKGLLPTTEVLLRSLWLS